MYVTTSQTGSPLMPNVLSVNTSPTITVSHGALARTTAFRDSPASSASREMHPPSSSLRRVPNAAGLSGTEGGGSNANTPTSAMHRNWLTPVLEREDELAASVSPNRSAVAAAAAASQTSYKEALEPVPCSEAVIVPTTTVTLASVSNVVSAVSLAAHENLVQWRRPVRPVVFREWYISRYCNEQQVRWIAKTQHICRPLEPVLVRYFQLWSLTGEAEFYTLFIPTVVWLGSPLMGVQIASLLCMGQYVTGTMKDSVCCPRPPCPPLQLRGKRDTHDNEYGFPSTHSSHSGVFAYFLYGLLLRLFPQQPFLCWLASVFFFANVSFSRIYLGMHWIGDLIGGWVVAFLSILFHVAFLDRWEAYVLQWRNPPWWAFLLLYVAFHVLAMVHATPHDPCPCYVDSMRFTGVMVGSFLGFWCFYSVYGNLAARKKPDELWDVLLTWGFLAQWVTCMVIVFVCKEVSSIAAGAVLKVFFKVLSGAYVTKMPQPCRGAYLAVASAIGLTTLGNERGPRRYIPFTVNNSFSFMRGSSFADMTIAENSSTSPNPTATNAAAAAASNASMTATSPHPMRADPTPIEEPDGYLSSQQAWSLRTHRHWWLWDVHKRSVSYAVTGFFISFVCQVILRELFGVEPPPKMGPVPPVPPVPPLA